MGASKADLRVPLDDRASYAADLRAFLTASYKMANDRALAFGTIWYRVLATHGRLDEALVDDLVGVLAGFGS